MIVIPQRWLCASLQKTTSFGLMCNALTFERLQLETSNLKYTIIWYSVNRNNSTYLHLKYTQGNI